jgi:hypothetical protein
MPPTGRASPRKADRATPYGSAQDKRDHRENIHMEMADLVEVHSVNKSPEEELAKIAQTTRLFWFHA